MLLDTDEELAADQRRRRFARQVRYAAEHTTAYARLVTPDRTLPLPGFDLLPVTTKSQYAADPQAYRATGVPAAMCFHTSGSTGAPTPVWAGADELRTMWALSAVSDVMHGHIGPQDHFVVATWARALLGNTSAAMAAGMAGAQVSMPGQLPPATMINLLRTDVPGGTPDHCTVLLAYPSYLDHLITRARVIGLGPADFGLRRIITGGEIVTDGLIDRVRSVFGDGVDVVQGYGMTETFPAGGSVCEQGHLHFESSRCIIEVKALDSDTPAAPGTYGTLVVTPLLPFRRATVLIRYDTGDVVQVLESPARCSLAALPATSRVLGKRDLCAPQSTGLLTPARILHSLERSGTTGHPIRFGFASEQPTQDTGVHLEVVVQERELSMAAERIHTVLAADRIEIGELTLVTDPALLTRPYPWRGDLWEQPLTSAAQVGDSARLTPA
ncbi:phenylacetate--CoA ligase family protein [Nakamurella silvestris]|nr:phenylacetate--CoA ligase family protein [Nakamurella silvestris]